MDLGKWALEMIRLALIYIYNYETIKGLDQNQIQYLEVI